VLEGQDQPQLEQVIPPSGRIAPVVALRALTALAMAR